MSASQLFGIDDETNRCLDYRDDGYVDDDTNISDGNGNSDDDDEIVAENKRISIGRQVILNDGQVGRIMSNEISFHYAVDFGDGSYSHDM
jgi:hypothetical protein